MSQMLIQFLVNGIVIGSIYGLAAIAYTTIFNVTGVINFAQGDMATLPALAAITVYGLGAGFLVAVLTAIVLGGVLGATMERLVVSPLRGSIVRTTVATIGVSILLQGTAVLVFGTEARTLPTPLASWHIRIFGAYLPGASITVLLVAVALVILLALLFQVSYLGRAFRACSVNPYAARLSGINVQMIRSFAFMLSGVIASIIGIIVAPITLMQYDTGFVIGVKGFIACIIGGLGNPLGAILGGLLVGVMESYATWLVGSGYKTAISLVLLVVLLLVRPGGILGALERPAR